MQGRNEARWRTVRNNFGVPMFEPEVFRKQMYCIEESAYDIVGTFRRPCSHSAPVTLFGAPIVIRRPGNFVPLPPLVT